MVGRPEKLFLSTRFLNSCESKGGKRQWQFSRENDFLIRHLVNSTNGRFRQQNWVKRAIGQSRRRFALSTPDFLPLPPSFFVTFWYRHFLTSYSLSCTFFTLTTKAIREMMSRNQPLYLITNDVIQKYREWRSSWSQEFMILRMTFNASKVTRSRPPMGSATIQKGLKLFRKNNIVKNFFKITIKTSVSIGKKQ